MLALKKRLTNTLQKMIWENPGVTGADSLLKGAAALRVKILDEADVAQFSEASLSYHEAEQHAVKAMQKRMHLTDADLMAHQMSLDLARDGAWGAAWAMTAAVYSGRMSRPKWEEQVRRILLRELQTSEHMMATPIPI